MTLELLFAQANQARTFLLMALCGCLAGIAVPLAGRLHRRYKAAGFLADGVIALLITAAAACILLHSGEGLRLYALLGLCIGGAAGCTCTHFLLRP